MRISDWSSDVCSSDLRDARQSDGVAQRAPADAAERADVAHLGHARHQRREQQRHDQHEDQRQEQLAEGPGDPVHDHFHRSEEHTSELQSLMRISYAVFCLKKTNYQYTILEQTRILTIPH